MPFILGAAALATGALALFFAGRRRWRAAALDVSRRFPLGTDGVIPGARSISHDGSARAVLLLHGFGDTPQSLAGLADALAEAGWAVAAPLLPGHGRTLEEFSSSRARQWSMAAEQAFDQLARQHEAVVVCGQSMGAALAISLAARKPVPALVLLAPYVGMPWVARATAAVWPLAQLFVPAAQTRDSRSVRDREAAERSLAYGYVTPRLLAELWRVVRQARRDIRRLRSPTLIVHSREDNRVSKRDVLAAMSRLQHAEKTLHWVSGCGHVLSVDYCKESVAALVIDWFQRHRAERAAPTAAR